MALSSYSELKTAIANWGKRSDLTDVIPDFITNAENEIYRDLRVSAMEAALNVMIDGVLVAIPSDYIELKNAYVENDSSKQLERVTLAWLRKNKSNYTGVPKYIARNRTNFILGPVSSDLYFDDDYVDPGYAAYAVKGTYYKRLAALSDSNTSNWLITNAPDLILAACLVQLGDYTLNDAMSAKWQAKMDAKIYKLNKQDNAEGFSGSQLMVRTE